MKIFCLLPLLLLFSISIIGQTSEYATSAYARNGVLISLTNLSPLTECAVQSSAGKIRAVKVDGDTAVLEVGRKRAAKTIAVKLGSIKDADRANLFKDLFRKGLPVRVSGYACGEDEALRAISVDRDY